MVMTYTDLAATIASLATIEDITYEWVSDGPGIENGHSSDVERFRSYYGNLASTAANLKTHIARVKIWANGNIVISSNCGTTSRFAATGHSAIFAAETATIDCQRCSK